MSPLVSIAIALSVLSNSVLGQTLPPPSSSTSTVTPKCASGEPGTLTVPGYGLAVATADQAQVGLSIAILNKTADGARIVAAGYASDVISSVRKIPGMFPENVTTTSISVYPETDYNSDTGTSTTVGYTYTNSLSVEIGSLTGDLLSKVLDTAVQKGGNNLTINGVEFGLSYAQASNKTVEARSQAVRDAKTTADQYSKDFGVTLGPLLSVLDQSTVVTPDQSTYVYGNNIVASGPDTSSSTTPLSIGKQNVYTQLSVTYTICTPLS